MQIRVECDSGRKGSERPVRFWLKDQERSVEQILDQWYGLHDTFYKVRADDRHFYVLRHQNTGNNDVWWLDAFRENRR